MTSGEFLRLFDDVCELTVLRGGAPVPLKTWKKPEPHCQHVDAGFDRFGFYQTVDRVLSVDGKFRRGFPTTNLGDDLNGQPVEVVATKADGRQVRFRAFVAREDWTGWCEYRSNGVVTVDEADTPILVGA